MTPNTLTAEDRKRLLELADKATAGPYMVSGVRARIDGQTFLVVIWPDGRGHAYIPYSDKTEADHLQSWNDARYTAEASPTTIKALLNTLDALEQSLAETKAAYELSYELGGQWRARASTAEANQLPAGCVAVCELCNSSNRPLLVSQGKYVCPGYTNNPCPVRPAPHGALQADSSEGGNVNCGPMAAETARPEIVAEPRHPESVRSGSPTKDEAWRDIVSCPTDDEKEVRLLLPDGREIRGYFSGGIMNGGRWHETKGGYEYNHPSPLDPEQRPRRVIGTVVKALPDGVYPTHWLPLVGSESVRSPVATKEGG